MLGCWLEGLPLLVVGVVVVVVVDEVDHADKIRTSAAAIQQREVAKLALILMPGNIALVISFSTFSNYMIGTRAVPLRRVYYDGFKRVLNNVRNSRDDHFFTKYHAKEDKMIVHSIRLLARITLFAPVSTSPPGRLGIRPSTGFVSSGKCQPYIALSVGSIPTRQKLHGLNISLTL